MANKTPTDSYNRPAVLGSFSGETVPVRVKDDGTVCVTVTDERLKYELVRTLRLDLSVARYLQEYAIEFDCFAVTRADSPFTMYIGSTAEDMRCYIDKCLSADVTAGTIYISNEANTANPGFAEIWFLRQKEAEH